ncbi:hypothetical protein [Bradyrhizobium sp. LB11.1]|uniref:hypothetical protein n=1 Tax=Bradyrhizobium sp. LB11.1 TaxID=3156326 RepID=UPI0033985B5E
MDYSGIDLDQILLAPSVPILARSLRLRSRNRYVLQTAAAASIADTWSVLMSSSLLNEIAEFLRSRNKHCRAVAHHATGQDYRPASRRTLLARINLEPQIDLADDRHSSICGRYLKSAADVSHGRHLTLRPHRFQVSQRRRRCRPRFHHLIAFGSRRARSIGDADGAAKRKHECPATRYRDVRHREVLSRLFAGFESLCVVQITHLTLC